jgi:endonuclease/exonuclease/phosphatase family metal-dependent hydrolase
LISDQDVVVLQELFHPLASCELLNALPYGIRTPIVGVSGEGWSSTKGDIRNGIATIPGGVAVLSKWPILECEQMIFGAFSGSETLCNKGCAYCVIDMLGVRLHVVGTHLQSEDGGSPAVHGKAASWQQRESQFRALRSFIDAKSICADDVLIIVGDMNVIRGTAEYEVMIDILAVHEPQFAGDVDATWDPDSNRLISGQQGYCAAWYDYVLVSRRHRNLPGFVNKCIVPEQVMSDHYPVFFGANKT